MISSSFRLIGSARLIFVPKPCPCRHFISPSKTCLKKENSGLQKVNLWCILSYMSLDTTSNLIECVRLVLVAVFASYLENELSKPGIHLFDS